MGRLAFVSCLLLVSNCFCDIQYGPDPWNYENTELNHGKNYDNVPPDLRITPRRKPSHVDGGVSMSEWFYKRILTIILKGGKVKKDDDSYVDVTLQMRFPKDHFDVIDNYLSLQSPFSEDMYRRSTGYVESAVTKPTVTETLVLAWTDYIQFFLVEYKFYLTWILGFLGAILSTMFIWNHMSHRHFYLLIFIVIYLYEAFVSYKEAEQQEYDKFISSVNTCKWYFWSSSCDIPRPDPLIFIKHMHPLKIGMRVFSMLVSEPMLVISSAVKVMLQGITDGLWFPLNIIIYGVLIVIIYAFLIVFFIMILFNFILNIPFNISFLLGMVNIGINQRSRTHVIPEPSAQSIDQGDRLSGANLDKLLNVCAEVLSNRHQPTQQSSTNKNAIKFNKNSDLKKFDKNSGPKKFDKNSGPKKFDRNSGPKFFDKSSGLKKSASTGRLSDLAHNTLALLPTLINSNNDKIRDKVEKGAGDNF